MKDRMYPHDRLPKIKASDLIQNDDVKWMVEWIEQLEAVNRPTVRELILHKQVEEQKAQIEVLKKVIEENDLKCMLKAIDEGSK